MGIQTSLKEIQDSMNSLLKDMFETRIFRRICLPKVLMKNYVLQVDFLLYNAI